MPQAARASADDKVFPPPLAEKGHEDVALRTRNPGLLSRKRLLGPVDKEKGDWALLAHSFVTGMIDAGTFLNWSVFVGMQTGNTVILGLSTASIPANPHAWTSTLVSLASFLLGAFLTYRSTALLSPSGVATNRLWLSTLYLLQALLIFVAAALTTADLVPHNRAGIADAAHIGGVVENVKIVALLPLLGFQAGMQIATSRLLGFNELPVNVLTSTYADLMGDAKLFVVHGNVKRNRRAMAVVLLLAGAISSGWLMRSEGGLMSVFWVAGFLKLLVAVFTAALHPAKTV